MRNRIDETLHAALTRNWEERLAKNYLDALQKSEESVPAYINDVFQRVDAKGTALVTYVAMMIAGLGICAPLVAKHPYEEAIVIAQISAFLLIAIGCLRCLSVFGRPGVAPGAKETLQQLERELIIRQELYRICHRAAIIFTLTAFISMPVMLLWQPEL
ncbi:MAG: hypothetical protein IT539_16150 [Bradyrhizobiaceae bacterium]|nr:hypothetical protein [Bradyrhizobiaceae bacterium]